MCLLGPSHNEYGACLFSFLLCRSSRHLFLSLFFAWPPFYSYFHTQFDSHTYARAHSLCMYHKHACTHTYPLLSFRHTVHPNPVPCLLTAAYSYFGDDRRVLTSIYTSFFLPPPSRALLLRKFTRTCPLGLPILFYAPCRARCFGSQTAPTR